MFVLAHLSDPHLGDMPEPALADLLNKRALGYLNWRLRRSAAWDPARLRQIVGAIHRLAPDHIAVTGDLVNLALPQEIERAGAWLGSLGTADRVSVVPGNHDAYVRGAKEELVRLWGAFMRGGAASGAPGVAFPFLRRFGDVALLGLSTAEPTGPFMATGALGADQLARAETALGELGQERLFRIVLLHHPLTTSWARRLRDAAALEAVLRRAGAELVLHGHNHRASVGAIETPSGPIPVVGATSASGLYRHGPEGEAGFNLIRIERRAAGFACHLTQYALPAAGGPVVAMAEISLPSGLSRAP